MRHDGRSYVFGGLVAGVLLAGEAFAGARLVDGQSHCTATNCQSRVVQGTYSVTDSFRSDPFTIQVFSDGNECLRLEMINQTDDLEFVLVSPDGLVWRDDDGAGGLRPIIRALTARSGWYALQVSHFGGAGQTANFVFKYGRYPSHNPNCNGAVPGQ